MLVCVLTNKIWRVLWVGIGVGHGSKDGTEETDGTNGTGGWDGRFGEKYKKG